MSQLARRGVIMQVSGGFPGPPWLHPFDVDDMPTNWGIVPYDGEGRSLANWDISGGRLERIGGGGGANDVVYWKIPPALRDLRVEVDITDWDSDSGVAFYDEATEKGVFFRNPNGSASFALFGFDGSLPENNVLMDNQAQGVAFTSADAVRLGLECRGELIVLDVFKNGVIVESKVFNASAFAAYLPSAGGAYGGVRFWGPTLYDNLLVTVPIGGVADSFGADSSAHFVPVPLGGALTDNIAPLVVSGGNAVMDTPNAQWHDDRSLVEGDVAARFRIVNASPSSFYVLIAYDPADNDAIYAYIDTNGVGLVEVGRFATRTDWSGSAIAVYPSGGGAGALIGDFIELRRVANDVILRRYDNDGVTVLRENVIAIPAPQQARFGAGTRGYAGPGAANVPTEIDDWQVIPL